MSDHHAERVERAMSPRRRAAERPPAAAAIEPTHPLLRLQRQVGNAQVQRLLAQRAEDEEEPVQAQHDGPTLQRAEDEEEPVQAQHDGPTVQRAEDEEEPVQAQHDGPTLQRAEDEEEPVQAKLEVGRDGGPVPTHTASMIQAARGGGQALDATTRQSMEHAFDTSFADVRLHHDSTSADLNARLGAQAFTTGTDIFVRDDAYQPQTESGTRLLSHELSHVVQQRSMPATEGTSVRPAGDSYEQAADASAERVAPAVSSAQRRLDEQSNT